MLDGGTSQMLSVGGVEPGAGIETVLHAMSLLRREHPGLGYLIVGAASRERDGGRYRQCVEALAHDLGIGDRIRFVDRVPDAGELLRLVAESDLVAVPSRRIDREQFDAIGIALSCGRPVVAVRSPVTAPMLRDGGGVLVEPDYDEAFADAVHVVLDPTARPSVRVRLRSGSGSTTAVVGTGRA
jgi:glycosyltransferase involved in cell wall biosynthesis